MKHEKKTYIDAWNNDYAVPADCRKRTGSIRTG